MNIMKTLINLEYSRYDLSRRGKHYSLFAALTIIFLLFITGLNLKGTHVSERAPFIYASMLLWSVVTILSAVHMVTFKSLSHRDWILSFPHSRLKLLYAQLFSLLRHSLNITLAVLAAAGILYYYSVRAGWYQPLTASGLLYLFSANTLFILAFLPLAVTFGLGVSLFLRSRPGALLLFPYLMMWMFPFIAESALGSANQDFYTSAASSPGRVLLAALVLCLAGWPLCHLLMKLIAAKGMNAAAASDRLSAARTASVRPGFRTLRMKSGSGSAGRLAPYLLLYRLHISRVHHIEKHLAIRILKLIVPLLIAAVVYLGFALEEEVVILDFIKPLFALLVMLGSIWMPLRTGIERKQLPWLLGFPQSRLALLLSGVAVVWTTVMRALSALMLSACAGSVTALLAGRTGIEEWSHSISWVLYSFLLSALALTVILCLLQIEYCTLKLKVLNIVMIPVAMLGPLHSFLLNRFMYSGLHSGASPDFRLLGLTALIALPVALCCIPAGAAYYHMSLIQPAGKKTRSKQA
ncbi:hypothetical protein D3C75_310020 [compost metagenome]